MDGAEQPPVALDIITLHGAPKFFSPTNHSRGLNLALVSRKFFDGTPSLAQQMAVLEAGKATEQFERMLWSDHEKDVIAKLQAAGMQVNALDLTPFKRAAAGIVEKNKTKVGADAFAQVVSEDAETMAEEAAARARRDRRKARSRPGHSRTVRLHGGAPIPRMRTRRADAAAGHFSAAR